MQSIEEFDQLIQQELVYKQNLISVIYNGGQHPVFGYDDLQSRYYGCTIKMEGAERYNKELYAMCQALKVQYDHAGPVTCHIFRAYPGSASFDIHADPVPVFLYMVQGSKDFVVDGKDLYLGAGDSYLIPPQTPHQAFNTTDSLMLSFGLESYLVNQL